MAPRYWREFSDLESHRYHEVSEITNNDILFIFFCSHSYLVKHLFLYQSTKESDIVKNKTKESMGLNIIAYKEKIQISMIAIPFLLIRTQARQHEWNIIA